MHRLTRPSSAMLVAVAALVFAATGVSFAAVSGGGGTTPDAHGASPGPSASAARTVRGPRGYRGYRGYRGPRGYSGAQGTDGASGAAGSPGLLALKTVESPHVTLYPGQNTYEVAPSTFQATCPTGFVVIGTGFDAGIGNVDDVLSYGTFVGGFVHNDVSITITDVHLQAICAQLPAGATVASASHVRAARERYRADLAAAAAALR